MLYKGSCSCNQWHVEVLLDKPLCELNPRECDCDFCKANQSRIVSDPNMSAEFVGEGVSIKKNGDQLANFYYCTGCNVLLGVGRSINGQLRGVVNSILLDDANSLGEPIQVQPRLLSADQKLERWNKLWGKLSGLEK